MARRPTTTHRHARYGDNGRIEQGVACTAAFDGGTPVVFRPDSDDEAEGRAALTRRRTAAGPTRSGEVVFEEFVLDGATRGVEEFGGAGAVLAGQAQCGREDHPFAVVHEFR